MIVAPLAEKSGVGQRTLLVDADRQGSSRFWARTRSPLRIPRLDSTPLYGEAFARQIATIASRYDDVVIDTGAADERDIRRHFVARCLFTAGDAASGQGLCKVSIGVVRHRVARTVFALYR